MSESRTSSQVCLTAICRRFSLDNGVSSVDSVFIFRSSAEEAANTSYDAIVVEQWTVVDVRVFKTPRTHSDSVLFPVTH